MATVATIQPERHVAWPEGIDWSFVYPLAFGTNDFMHILMNALETSIESSPLWKPVKKAMVSISALLGNREYSRMVVATRMKIRPATEKKLMLALVRRHIDWRWEYLEESFDDLIPHERLRILCEVFDYDLLAKGGSMDEVFLEVRDVISNGEVSGKMMIAFAAVCKIVGKRARWSKGCKCHESVLLTAKDGPSRFQAMVDAGCPEGSCFWMGKRLVELVLGDFRLMLSEFGDSDAVRLITKELCGGGRDPAILDEMYRCLASIREEVELKLSPMIEESPELVVGAYGEAFWLSHPRC